MKEKEIREIIRALEQISLGVDTIKTVLKRSLKTENHLLNTEDHSLNSENSSLISESVVNTFLSTDKFSENKSSSINEESPLSKTEVQASSTFGISSKNADGFLDVLDLSGDIKKVQLALMRMGKGTALDVAKVVSLDVDEVRIYLKTLMRDSSVLALSSGDSETVFRTVLKKKGHEPSKGAASLLDKLL